MTFNTGKPVPSTDPRDLYDNAENLDKLVNGADPIYADRKGILRQSWAGMENDFDTSQEGRENTFTLSQADKERIAKLDASALRTELTFGLNSQWADLPIMRANGFTVETSTSYEPLLGMLSAGRFDAFPRGLNERNFPA